MLKKLVFILLNPTGEKEKKITVAPVWLWNQFQCKKHMVGVPAHPKDLYRVAKTADFRETYWWLKVGCHFGNQDFIHRTQIDRHWWNFSWSRRCSTNERGFSVWFTLFYCFFFCPFALSLNEKWTFRVWLLIKLSNILLEITKTNKE